MFITYWFSGRNTFQNVFLFQFVSFTSNSDTGDDHHNMNYVLIKSYSNRKFKCKNIFLIGILIFLRLCFDFWILCDVLVTDLTITLKKPCLLERVTVWQEPIWIKVNGWWQILAQHQRPRIYINWNPPFQTVTYGVNLTSQHSHLEIFLLWSEGGISINADSGPHR